MKLKYPINGNRTHDIWISIVKKIVIFITKKVIKILSKKNIVLQ